MVITHLVHTSLQDLLVLELILGHPPDLLLCLCVCFGVSVAKNTS